MYLILSLLISTYVFGFFWYFFAIQFEKDSKLGNDFSFFRLCLGLFAGLIWPFLFFRRRR